MRRKQDQTKAAKAARWHSKFMWWPATVTVDGHNYTVWLTRIECCYVGRAKDYTTYRHLLYKQSAWAEQWRVRFPETLIERNERIMRGEPRPGGDLGEPATDVGAPTFNLATGQWEEHQVQSTKALVQSMGGGHSSTGYLLNRSK